MANKKKFTLSKTILNLVVIIPTIFSVVRKTFALIGFEARLAGRSIILICVLSLIAVILLSSIWLGLLVMLFLYLTTVLQWSLQHSMLLITALNILMLVIVGLVIVKAKKNLSFPETRRQLRSTKRLREND